MTDKAKLSKSGDIAKLSFHSYTSLEIGFRAIGLPGRG